MNIYDFWKAVLGQNEIEIRKYFQNDAYINWHCTNEQFNGLLKALYSTHPHSDDRVARLQELGADYYRY